MRNFQFDADGAEDLKIEEIIDYRKRKIFGQQLIFSSVLFIILGVLAIYIGRRVIYAEFDGYIETDYDNYRAWSDIYLVNQYTREGDIVMPGDTLYSYIYLSDIINSEQLYSEHEVITDDRNIRLQTGIAELDANVLAVRISQLRKQIRNENQNIQFGLTDNSHKMDLQRELAEAEEQLNATQAKIDIYYSIGKETDMALQRSGLEFSDNRDNVLVDYMSKTAAIRYMIAEDTSVVTKLWAQPRMPVFQSDPILQLQNLNLQNCNMRVMAYVPANDMHKVSNHTKAEILVNDEVTFTATVQLLGARVEELPTELRSSLSHVYSAIMVVFRPDPGQTLPFWAAVDKVPVRIRIKKFGPDASTRNDDYWFIDGKGLTTETIQSLGLNPNHNLQCYETDR